MTFHARYAEITAPVNTIQCFLATVVLDSSNAPFAAIDNMSVNQNQMAFVWSIKHIAINAVRVDSKSVSKLA